MNNINAVILAAGEGKRMKSKYPKVSHKLCGKPMVQHVVDSVNAAGICDIVVVVGHMADSVKECIKSPVRYALQEKQLGTGHAVMCSTELIKGFNGTTLVLYGDTPLITESTLKSFISYHKNSGFYCTVMTAIFEDPTGYGRIIKNSCGNIEKIVEHRDASDSEKEIKEINSGLYCFDTQKLIEALKYVKNNNAQGEYYLTDVIGVMRDQGHKVGAYMAEDNTEIMGINSRLQLSEVEGIMRRRILNRLMADGVTIIDPASTYIDAGASIGRDTVILPGTIIEGETVVGEDCEVGPYTRLTDAVIKDRVKIANSVIIKSEVRPGSKVGPFAYIRPDSVIGENTKIGDFVEIKKSTIGNGTKVSHLTYIGDSEVGENVNFGCGTVTVNYDGNEKHKTIIGNNAFIGCNTNLVAPVKVNDGSYIAAGSTITQDVPEGALAIARERQVNKEGWVAKRNLYRKNK